MLTFPDDSQVGVLGLDHIMADLYKENKQPTDETIREIISRLEEKKNFIPSSELVRREYAYVLLREYRNYIRDKDPSVG